jgi:hypothetical protein
MNQQKHTEYRTYAASLASLNPDVAVSAVLLHVYDEAVAAMPKQIVEIGTGVNGLRTKVLCKVADLFDAKIDSCDIRDCSGCGNSWYSRWRFWLMDGGEFETHWNPDDKIDLLMIDTDERFNTTLRMWNTWERHLSQKATVMFRCSNLQKTLFYEDGTTTQRGWDNQRGVAKVLEGILGRPIDETAPFELHNNWWAVKHWPWGAGLTVMRRT